ncbi:MAG: cob(I)yrinic acid a,c-diamide adenosyltransferase [Thermodesulfobacteriota bacterium]|nr:cob(I)yrinic acid a,c-diamide adenosyltransferase [Thermodesulfobacteriota bacterium]
MSDLGKGYVHIYTGDGKGKTTAALGLALRGAGCGLRTIVIQFMKGRHYSELDAAKMLEGLLVIEQHGSQEFCRLTNPPDPGDVKRAHHALERIHEIVSSCSCDILIADEVIVSMMFHLVTEDEILDIIHARPDGMELVLTGRGATPALMDAADLVTEMKEVKHYYARDVQARKGIEN